MSKELFIGSDENEVKIALLEDKILVELHKEKTSDNFRVGDIYIGRVKRIIPGLNAAFIDIGHEKDAFLHYLDLGPNILTFNKYVKNCLNGNIKSSSLENIDIEPTLFLCHLNQVEVNGIGHCTIGKVLVNKTLFDKIRVLYDAG